MILFILFLFAILYSYSLFRVIRIKKTPSFQSTLAGVLEDVEMTIKEGKLREAISLLPLVVDVVRKGKEIQKKQSVKDYHLFRLQNHFTANLEKLAKIEKYLKSVKVFTKQEENYH